MYLFNCYCLVEFFWTLNASEKSCCMCKVCHWLSYFIFYRWCSLQWAICIRVQWRHLIIMNIAWLHFYIAMWQTELKSESIRFRFCTSNPSYSDSVKAHNSLYNLKVLLGRMLCFFCLWSPYVIGRPYIFSSCFFLLSFFFPRLISAVGDWMFTILWHMVWP